MRRRRLRGGMVVGVGGGEWGERFGDVVAVFDFLGCRLMEGWWGFVATGGEVRVMVLRC